MKKFVSTLLLVCTIFTMSIPAFAASSAELPDKSPANQLTYDQAAAMSDAERSARGIYRAVVLANGVNIRKGPGTNYISLGMMNKGDTVYIHRYNCGPNEDWCYVLCDTPNKGVYGYIMYKYLQENEHW